MRGRLQGKVAFISGAGAGIGRACARLFAREGAHVVIAELVPELGRAVEAEVLEAAGRALFVQTDVTDEASIARALEATLLRFGALHVLVNCAGGSIPDDGPVTDIDVSVWDHSLALDLKGTFLCCRHAIPHLVSAGGGSIVNFSSMVALLGKPVHAYSAAKGGVLSLTRALAASYGPKRVRVNAICPGLVLTDRIRARVESGMPGLSKHGSACTETHPFAIGEPEDIAHIALFLASDEARMIHGATVAADGGMSAY